MNIYANAYSCAMKVKCFFFLMEFSHTVASPFMNFENALFISHRLHVLHVRFMRQTAECVCYF